MGHAEVVSELVAAGADVNLPWTAAAAPLLQREPLRYSPLALASSRGHIEVVRLLLASGAKVEPLEGQAVVHPLISAADGGHVDVVRLLVAHLGAQPGPEFQELLDSALHPAAEWGHPDVAQVLLAAGANPNASEGKNDPVVSAAWWGHEDVVALLLDAGAVADVHARNKEHRCTGGVQQQGPAPLHLAADDD